jgi:hypothetical protein
MSAMPTPLSETTKLEGKLAKLSDLSKKNAYDVYNRFDWPQTLDESTLVMSEKLMSVYNTPQAQDMTKEQLIRLSHFEQSNYSSLNTHGERELLVDVIDRMHTPKYKLFSEYMHHLVTEENSHLWFFAEYCNRYGKLYQPKKMIFASQFSDEVEDFLVFARLFVFEEIVVYFNKVMGKDESLPMIVRQLNRTHYEDESRHVAFGQEIALHLYNTIEFESDEVKFETKKAIELYLLNYMAGMVRLFYPLHAYKDAGIPNAYQFREKLMKEPGRVESHLKIAHKSMRFLAGCGILGNDESLDIEEYYLNAI